MPNIVINDEVLTKLLQK